MNGLEFNVEKAPPTAQDLADERRRLDIEESRLRRKGKVAMLGVVGGFVTFFVAAFYFPVTDWWLAPLGFALLVAMIGIGYDVVNIYPRREEIAQRESRLIPLCAKAHGEECVSIVGWCEGDAVLARYQSAVVASGRELVRGDYLAMEAWVDSSEAREACAKLREPMLRAV